MQNHKNNQILLADAHNCSRIGLVQVLLDAGFEIVAEATSTEECLRLLVQHQPLFLLLACNLLPADPLSLIKTIRQEQPHCYVVLYLANCNDLPLQALMDAGVRGMVTKKEPTQTLLQILWLAARGQIAYSPKITKALLREPTEAGGQPTLTPQQRQLLLLLTQGLSNRQIAAELGLSHQTVRNYLTDLYKVIGVSSRTKAVHWARQQHISQ